MSIAQYSGVRPFMSQAPGLAPLSSRNIAMSKLRASIALISGVMPSGLGWLMSAPALTMATAQR